MDTKPWYKSKVVWFNLAAAAAPVAAYLAANPAFLQAYMTPAHFVTYTGAVGVANVALRFITTVGITLFSSTSAP